VAPARDPFPLLLRGSAYPSLASVRRKLSRCGSRFRISKHRLLQRDGDGLPPVLDLFTAAAFQLSMFELMHDPSGDPFLSR
jgi:hypothetical protein